MFDHNRAGKSGDDENLIQLIIDYSRDHVRLEDNDTTFKRTRRSDIGPARNM